MSSTRIHSHSSLPAPVFHSGASSVQSKSHVLAGVQDAYWSDDESDDRECPLCLEEMDVDELNFKPCPCGYQICRFCWHHIKENLNGRCPACRREYSDDAVQFKPIDKENHKRLTQQKKQRERERKDLDALGRRHLANVRVVQRNVVYIVGMGPRFAKEELIPTLRSNEYFGQYGKISKILVVKRSSNHSSGRTPAIGLYVTYHRREDAARCISAVDGAPSPSGGSDIMRASYGTTKYCMAFLRGASCGDHSCMNLHEWGDESDCFTKEDLTTLKHTMKDMENRSRTSATGKKMDEAEAGLPRSAGWAKNSNSIPSGPLHSTNTTSLSSTARSSKRTTIARNPRSVLGNDSRLAARSQQDRKVLAAKSPSQASLSRPQTPSLPQATRPITPIIPKSVKTKEESLPAQPPPPSESPTTSSAVVDSDIGSGLHDASSTSPAIRPQSAQSSAPSAPPGIPPPPGLSAPPGLPLPSLSKALQGPESPYLQPLYQMSSQAQALVDDMRARREALVSSATISPFPDFDRTLQTLSKGVEGGFSFNLDPKLASDAVDSQMVFPELEAEATLPFHGSFFDAFPALRPSAPLSGSLIAPPGISYPHSPSRSIYDPLATRSSPLDRQQPTNSSYVGSFNPFDVKELPQRQYSPLDDDPTRKMSRFGFARGRQGSASSPMPMPPPLTNSDNASHASYYESPDLSIGQQQVQLAFQRRQPVDFPQTQPVSPTNPQTLQRAQSQTHSPYLQQPTQFQPFENGVSEAQLRDLIHSSRGRTDEPRAFPADQNNQWNHTSPDLPFNDPAIMSARMTASSSFESAMSDSAYAMNYGVLISPQIQSGTISFGPPPGLSSSTSFDPGNVISNFDARAGNGTYSNMDVSQASGSAHVSISASPAPSLALSSTDFPALVVETKSSSVRSQTHQTPDECQAKAKDNLEAPESVTKVLAKAEKKAAAAERAAERQKLAQEKAAAKAAERERIAQEKAAERERSRLEREKAAIDKAEKLKEDREKHTLLKAERAKQEKERAEQERVAKEQAALLVAERERNAQAKKAAKLAKQAAASAVTGRPEAPKPSSTTSMEPVPMLSKMPKKYKPVTKPIKIPQDGQITDGGSAGFSADTLEMPFLPETSINNATDTGSNDSQSVSLEGGSPREPTSLEELLAQIDLQCPNMNVSQHPIFDTSKINPAAKMPLEYGPLVHALSALSVGGGSFANSMPSGSIDNAVSSFQQLLETLTQTISDLLRLLPRTTWDDSSSFDGVLRDMLKGDDFLDDGNEEGGSKEDEVAALTMALERRARWMEVQLSKLEELHRDINMAAVRAVLSFNDNGWDSHGYLPRVGNTLQRFDNLGLVTDGAEVRAMTADELEKKLVVAQEAAVFAEAEVKEMVENLQILRPDDEEEYY